MSWPLSCTLIWVGLGHPENPGKGTAGRRKIVSKATGKETSSQAEDNSVRSSVWQQLQESERVRKKGQLDQFTELSLILRQWGTALSPSIKGPTP